MSHIYEVSLCPLCGSQCNYDGGYEGEGWIFDCEHRAYGSEYGEIEPLTILVDATAQATIAVTAAAPAMERQKREKVIEDAEATARQQALWDALTPEQQERERRTNEAMRAILHDSFRPMIEDQIRNANRFLWGAAAVIPKASG